MVPIFLQQRHWVTFKRTTTVCQREVQVHWLEQETFCLKLQKRKPTSRIWAWRFLPTHSVWVNFFAMHWEHCRLRVCTYKKTKDIVRDDRFHKFLVSVTSSKKDNYGTLYIKEVPEDLRKKLEILSRRRSFVLSQTAKRTFKGCFFESNYILYSNML